MTGVTMTTGRPENSDSVYDVRGVNFTYPGTTRQILHDITFGIKAGEIMEILGPNGAGKSTLLSLMMGFLKADSGSIEIEGVSIGNMTAKQIAGKVGYVPQTHEATFDYRVKDFIMMGIAPEKGMFGRPSAEDEDKCLAVMEDLSIGHLAERSYMQIIGGERQQALIARAIMQDPRIILFDEPTAHLDYGNTYRTLQMVKEMAEKGFAVIITTHDPNQALLLGGKAGIIDGSGHMISGPVSEIVTEEQLSQIYNCDLKLVQIEEMDRVACVTPKL